MEDRGGLVARGIHQRAFRMQKTAIIYIHILAPGSPALARVNDSGTIRVESSQLILTA
jgi:hypothetical protein